MILSTGRSERGFSLLELMVVIFIIGLMSGVAVLTLPDKSGQGLLVEQRYQLIGALRTARAEAVFSGRSLGLLWTGNKGRFHTLTAEGWVPITTGVLAKPVTTDERVRSEITLDGEPIKYPEDDSDDRLMTPQLWFLGDGQVSPFEWRLATAGAESVSFDSRLDVEADPDSEER